MDDVLDVKEAAKYLHCSESTVRKLMRTKQIPSFRVANRIYFKKSLLDLWIENQCKSNWNVVEENDDEETIEK